MSLNYFYFFVSFLGDLLAYIYYQKFVESRHTNYYYLSIAVISAFLVWFFIFKLQDRGQVLHTFIPIWAAGTAVFGYFISGLITKTAPDKLFSIQSLLSITAIGTGIFFLSRLSS